MKKSLFSMLTVATMLLMGSCSNEEPQMKESGDQSTVTVKLELPGEMQARTEFGTGNEAKQLTYAVYETGENKPLAVCSVEGQNGLTTVGKKTMQNRATTITLQLTTGKEYDFVFWADDPDHTIYKFDETAKTIEAVYSNAKANQECYDAFFNVTKNYKVSGDASISAELKRPFAQLNVLTDDKAAAKASGFDVKESTVTVEVPNMLNLYEGTVSGQAGQTFALETIPDTGKDVIVINGKNYEHLLMNYILVGNTKETLAKVAFTVSGTNTTTGADETHSIDFANVPVQRNYRTNIYGSLLTNSVDVNVVINPLFETSDLNVNYKSIPDEVATPGSTVELAGGVKYVLDPTTVAEGVTINGNGAILVCPATGKKMTANGVTLSNVELKSDATNYTGSILEITGTNVVLDNVEVKGDNKSRNGILVADGASVTIKNSKFDQEHNATMIKTTSNCVVTLENCEFSNNLMYAFNGGGQLNATNCVFSGWMSGWNEGAKFVNCTFNGANTSWYPAAICYGDTQFDNCTFDVQYNNMIIDENGNVNPSTSPDAKYCYNYAVSTGTNDITITFMPNCKYSNGSVLDTNVYIKDVGDGKGVAKTISINGTDYEDNDTYFRVSK